MASRLKQVSKNVSKQSVSFDTNITIDAKHNEMINHFTNQSKSIPLLKEELRKLIEEYNHKDNSRKNDLDYIIYKDNLKENINFLKNKISSIYDNQDLNNYYLEVGTLLHSYYENIENSKNNVDHYESFEDNLLNYDEDDDLNNDISDSEGDDNDIIPKEQKESIKKNNVLTFFKNDDIKADKVENNVKADKTDNVYTSMKISDYVKHEQKFKKTNFLDEYLQKIDPNYVSKIKIDVNICKCPHCTTEMILYPSDGIQVCDKCGFQQNVLIESDKPSFKDPPLEACYFTYKRINHFNEWLAQFQAKETTEIPDEVYEKILIEIKKERVSNLEKLDTKKIRQYLKKIKLNKYYDHAAHILYQINGVPPPCMSKELEEKLRLMFKEIQGPFMDVCPKSRKNFLNYSYILHKFVELLGLDNYKIYFPLLKDREKLHQTDMIWKKICDKLGWHFIKSI
jgi:hypothetical protein